MTKYLCLLVITAASTQAVSAQGFGRIQETQTNTAYFFHAVPGEATVQVSVLGAVRVPGIYVVGATTRLDELFAMTGGSQQRESPEISSEVDVKLFREDGGKRQLVYQDLLESMLTEPGRYPPLAEGDVLIIDQHLRRKFGWREGLSVLTAVGTLALVVDRVFR